MCLGVWPNEMFIFQLQQSFLDWGDKSVKHLVHWRSHHDERKKWRSEIYWTALLLSYDQLFLCSFQHHISLLLRITYLFTADEVVLEFLTWTDCVVTFLLDLALIFINMLSSSFNSSSVFESYNLSKSKGLLTLREKHKETLTTWSHFILTFSETHS